MFLIIYEDYGQEPKNLRTAASLTIAKAWVKRDYLTGSMSPEVSEETRLQIVKASPDLEWETDEQGREVMCFGDAQYAIEPMVHVS